jgi:hypothetical protein
MEGRMKFSILGNGEYPARNPRHAHTLEVAGTLPSVIPIGDFIAVYASDMTPEKVSGPCQILNNIGPEQFSYKGQSYREISHRLGLSKNTVLEIVKRDHAA